MSTLVSMRWPISASQASTPRSSAIASGSDCPSRASGWGRRVSEKRRARLSSFASRKITRTSLPRARSFATISGSAPRLSRLLASALIATRCSPRAAA